MRPGAKNPASVFRGYEDKEFPSLRGRKVTLKNDAKLLDGSGSNGIGYPERRKSLTYSTQVVNGDELARVKDPNA